MVLKERLPCYRHAANIGDNPAFFLREKEETCRGDDDSRIESRNSKASHDTVYTSNAHTLERRLHLLRIRPLRGRAGLAAAIYLA